MIEDTIRRFIVEELNGPPAQVTNDYHLIERGVVDSLALFHLVSFIEETYGITVEDIELIPDNFQTIDAIASLVASKRSSMREP